MTQRINIKMKMKKGKPANLQFMSITRFSVLPKRQQFYIKWFILVVPIRFIGIRAIFH